MSSPTLKGFLSSYLLLTVLIFLSVLFLNFWISCLVHFRSLFNVQKQKCSGGAENQAPHPRVGALPA